MSQSTNNCKTEDCPEGWTGSFVIPKCYLPVKVTKFNAHAQHGATWGEEFVNQDDLELESLYPVDPEVVDSPDFHDLDSFGDIDLTSIGVFTDEESDLWKDATDTNADVKLRYYCRKYKIIALMVMWQDLKSCSITHCLILTTILQQIEVAPTDAKTIFFSGTTLPRQAMTAVMLLKITKQQPIWRNHQTKNWSKFALMLRIMEEAFQASLRTCKN